MLTSRTIRQSLSALLVLLGAVFIYLATEAWVGAVLVGLGISIELIAIALKHR